MHQDDNPLVSIITPTYNQGQFIAETIESILNQDYTNLEYIIIDGVSTDNTVEIIKRYESDKRLTWISEPDAGMADAINKGIKRASGDYMTWLNSDDVYATLNVVSDTVTYFRENPDVSLVHGDIVYVDAEGNLLDNNGKGQPFNIVDTVSYSTCILQPGTFWRRSLWDQAGEIRTDLTNNMDTEYWLRASRFGKFHYLSGVRAKFRAHDDSITGRTEIRGWHEREKLIDELEAQPELYPEIIGLRPQLEANLAFKRAQYFMRTNNDVEARANAREAFFKMPISRRKVATTALLIDTYLSTNFSKMISEFYSKVK